MGAGSPLTVVADPPWRFGDNLPGQKRGAAKHYSTLTPPEIVDVMLPFTRGLESVRVFLWRVASMQEEARFVIRSLALTVKAELVWIKMRGPCSRCGGDGAVQTAGTKLWRSCPSCHGERTKLHFGMGRTVRASHETCLIAVRGRPPVLSHSIRSVFFAPLGRHSEKPEAFFDLVEQLSPGPYLELFARRRRSGWHCEGNELTT